MLHTCTTVGSGRPLIVVHGKHIPHGGVASLKLRETHMYPLSPPYKFFSIFTLY